MVLGMHRSGTSSVAGVLTRLGCAAPKNLMPANPGNARGYFESTTLMAFHDELLCSAGSSWNDWRPFDSSWFSSPVATTFRQRAKELFAQEFGDRALPVLKDPRVCRFAPFWFDVLKELGAAPRVVMPLRAPMEVAHSLHAIHSMPLQQGLILWLRHVLDAEYSSRSTDRSIFTWKEFRNDWRSVSNRIASETGLSWPRPADISAYEVDSFLASELVHFDAQGNVRLEWISRAYSALVELSCHPNSNLAQAELDDVRLLLDQATTIFGPLLADYEIELEGARGELDVQRRELETWVDRNAILEVATGKTMSFATVEHVSVSESNEGVRAEPYSVSVNFSQRKREKFQLSEVLSTVLANRDILADRCVGLEAKIEEATRNRDDLAEALSGVLIERDSLATIVQRIEFEKNELSFALSQASQELDHVKDQSLEAAAALQANQAEAILRIHRECAETIEGIERYHEEVLRTARIELTNAEAAFYCSKFEAERPVAARILPISYYRRKLAKMVLNSGLFDTEYYHLRYPDAIARASNRSAQKALAAALHYIEFGSYLGFQPNALFDSSWYLAYYDDVRRAGRNPLWHYIRYGWREGRDPGPGFNTEYYVTANPDVKASGMNPLLHYIRFGRDEGRQPVSTA